MIAKLFQLPDEATFENMQTIWLSFIAHSEKYQLQPRRRTFIEFQGTHQLHPSVTGDNDETWYKDSNWIDTQGGKIKGTESSKRESIWHLVSSDRDTMCGPLRGTCLPLSSQGSMKDLPGNIFWILVECLKEKKQKLSSCPPG
jgi:hypothetical protein